MSKDRFVNICCKQYLELFAIDWIEEYSWSDDSQSELSFKYGVNKINDFVESSFVQISRSIISGEYVLESDIENDLMTFVDIVSNNEYAPESNNKYKDKLYDEYRKLDENLSYLLSRYRHFVSIVVDKIDRSHPCFIVNAVYTGGKRHTYSLLDNITKYVIPVYQLDHLLSYDEADVRDLILLHEELLKKIPKQKDELKPIFEVLKDKCYFLMKKLVYQNNITEYSIDFLRKRIDLSVVNSEVFAGFDSSFNFFHSEHYNEYDSNVIEWQQKAYNKELKIGQMVLLMKYYKDCDRPSLIQVDNLLNEFNLLYNKLSHTYAHRKFDNYALCTLKNYMYNSRLSLKLRGAKYNYDSLCVDLEDIELIQAETQIKNFYPYRKAIEYLLLDVRNSMKGANVDPLMIIQKLDFLNECIAKFETAINWCDEERFYPVQNMYNECISEDKKMGGIVFTASSYCRPIDYSKLREDLQEYKSETRLLKNELALYEERVEIQQLKREMDSSKKSNIEILGAFTAVITFLFGCVNVFSNDNNSQLSIVDQIEHIVCLGLILLLFVNAIYFLTMKKEKKLIDYLRHPRFYAFGLSSIAYVVILVVLVLKLL